MDISEIYRANDYNAEVRHALEDAVVGSIRAILRDWDAAVDSATVAVYQPTDDGVPDDPMPVFDSQRHREHVFRIIAALAGCGNGGWDYWIDCAAIERVIKERRELLEH